jgi:TfoX/Sxy family transcriptional regulator of competence genes
MTYDLDLADRIRELVAGENGLTEKRMFGGLAFLINGNMAVSVSGRGGVMLRCDPATSAQYVSPPHVERMAMRGREMDGWLHVDSAVLHADTDLRRWVRIGINYAKSLPSK